MSDGFSRHNFGRFRCVFFFLSSLEFFSSQCRDRNKLESTIWGPILKSNSRALNITTLYPIKLIIFNSFTSLIMLNTNFCILNESLVIKIIIIDLHQLIEIRFTEIAFQPKGLRLASIFCFLPKALLPSNQPKTL